jgi:hypothetical protein
MYLKNINRQYEKPRGARRAQASTERGEKPRAAVEARGKETSGGDTPPLRSQKLRNAEDLINAGVRVPRASAARPNEN